MPSSAVAAGDLTRPRNRAPTPSRPIANTIPAISAPTNPNAGDQGERPALVEQQRPDPGPH